MPRTIPLPVHPPVAQHQRQQIVSALVHHLQQYYSQTRQHSLQHLAQTVESQAFRHSHTVQQYADRITEAYQNELHHATRVHAEITHSTHSSSSAHPIPPPQPPQPQPHQQLTPSDRARLSRARAMKRLQTRKRTRRDAHDPHHDRAWNRPHNPSHESVSDAVQWMSHLCDTDIGSSFMCDVPFAHFGFGAEFQQRDLDCASEQTHSSAKRVRLQHHHSS